MSKRTSGILMHISSLPGPYGIGDFGQGACQFVDFLEKSSQKHWQILPLGMTGAGDSPYQCFSAFAGNPYFIDLRELIDMGLLTEKDVEQTPLGEDPERVDYDLVFANKMALLRMAYQNGKQTLEKALNSFYRDNKDWLRDFALYMSLNTHHQNKTWMDWEPRYKKATSKAVGEFEKNHRQEFFFWVFTQYFFFKQWNQLRAYANAKGVRIIGDLPYYVSYDSADVWANPELFQLNSTLHPLTVAGCPPDAFSETGQLWGNPIYDWSVHESGNYDWWVRRIKASFELYDVLRIDHFRGFESYWEVSYGAEDARSGRWVKGPGLALFHQLREKLGPLDIIAEDLGFLTEEVVRLIQDTGYPGMKILQFAFDPEKESDYLPHHHIRNMVVYTGTHDNDTLVGWLDKLPKEVLLYLVNYLKLNFDEGLGWGVIRGAWSSVANMAIAPMQDFLELGTQARMNTPSTVGDNWKWRMAPQALTDELAKRIADMTRLYGRSSWID